MKYNKIWQRIASISAIASLTACMTIGEEFTSDVKWITAQKTNKSEIQKHLGEPFRVGYDSGLLTYTYAYYRYSALRPARTKDLTVRFNKDNTVQSYSFASSFDEDKQSIR